MCDNFMEKIIKFFSSIKKDNKYIMLIDRKIIFKDINPSQID